MFVPYKLFLSSFMTGMLSSCLTVAWAWSNDPTIFCSSAQACLSSPEVVCFSPPVTTLLLYETSLTWAHGLVGDASGRGMVILVDLGGLSQP